MPDTLRPFLLLVECVLAWAVLPATACLLLSKAKYWLGQRLNRPVKPPSRRAIASWYAGYAFIAVSFGWATLFVFYPLLKAVLYSFTDKSMAPTVPVEWVGLRNYIQMAADRLWWRSVGVTALFILGTLPYSILISLVIASLVVRLPNAAQTFIKAALFLPGVVGFVVTAAIIKWVFYPGEGFANMLLRRLGLIAENLTWFADPNLALPTLIIMSWLSANGIAVIIYCAALGNVPRDYYEAADIDGATTSSKFIHITWPLVKPATIYVVITGLIAGFQVFAPAMLITGGGPQYSTHFVNYEIYRTFYYKNALGTACAMSVALMLIIVLISIINYKFLATDVEY